uniref:(northern house mosquito) hypothetical protein n=1 Tax=Culex pipiens TaxID=7175 RepID=A0A8D8AMF9_CULPI
MCHRRTTRPTVRREGSRRSSCSTIRCGGTPPTGPTASSRSWNTAQHQHRRHHPSKNDRFAHSVWRLAPRVATSHWSATFSIDSPRYAAALGRWRRSDGSCSTWLDRRLSA